MSIQEFLLARVAEDESDALAGAPVGGVVEPSSASRQSVFDDRRAVIYRHHDRSMTVTSIGKFETVTRCGVCPHESTRPCTALKDLAQSHRDHPDYDAAWDVKSRVIT